MSDMNIRRGPRRSLIVRAGHHRFRLTLGRFRWDAERRDGAWMVAGGLFLLTYIRRG
jgi:hypothetical protein